MVDAVRVELSALHRRLAESEETISDLTDISDAAQLAIDRLRRDLAKREAETGEALAQRDAVAAELFRMAQNIPGIATDGGGVELARQRDALALELFRLTRRTDPGWLRTAIRRLLPRRLRGLL